MTDNITTHKTTTKNAQTIASDLAKELDAFTEAEEQRLAQMRRVAIDSAEQNHQGSASLSNVYSWLTFLRPRPVLAGTGFAMLLGVSLFSLNKYSDSGKLAEVSLSNGAETLDFDEWILQTSAEDLAIASYDLDFYAFLEAEL